GVLPSLAALVTAGTAELVCFSIQHGVQRLFHRATNHLAKMIANPRFIDLDHLTHRLLVTHRLLLQCMKKPSILKVRKIPDVIRRDLTASDFATRYLVVGIRTLVAKNEPKDVKRSTRWKTRSRS